MIVFLFFSFFFFTEPPPLPQTAPPQKHISPNNNNNTPIQRSPWPSDMNSYGHGTIYQNIGPPPSNINRNSVNNSNSNINSKASTLPPYVNPPYVKENSTRRPSESSSESEPNNVQRKDKRPNVLSSLFRKKRATHLWLNASLHVHNFK